MFKVTPKQAAGLLLPFLLLVVTGWLGLDFGYHWDEKKYQLGEVKHMLETETLLPRTYMYPETSYWLELSALIPAAAQAVRLTTPFGKSLPWLKKYLIHITQSEGYLLDTRLLFLFLTALSVVWIYFAIRSWRNSHWEALLGATLLGSSWEVAYHARWVATDGLVLSLSALALFCLSAFLATKKRNWLYTCAAICGIAMATKYTAALLFLMVILAGGSETGTSAREKFWMVTRAGFLALALYLALTPGTVLQPGSFFYWVNFIRAHYANGGHGGYDIAAGLPHLLRISQYFSLVFFSNFPLVAALLSFFLIVGMAATIKNREKLGFISIVMALVFILYFSRQRVMIVRNLLIVAPFLTLLLVRGVAECSQRLMGYRLRFLPVGLVAASLFINQVWLIRTAETIAHRSPGRTLGEAAEFIRSAGTDRIFVSPLLVGAFKSVGISVENQRQNWQDADHILFYASEGDVENWPANLPSQVERWFGPYEVNFDVYPSWTGENRILLMQKKRFEHALAAWKNSPWLTSVPTSFARK